MCIRDRGFPVQAGDKLFLLRSASGDPPGALLALDGQPERGPGGYSADIDVRRVAGPREPLAVPRASPAELENHRERLRAIDRTSGGKCVWLAAGEE